MINQALITPQVGAVQGKLSWRLCNACKPAMAAAGKGAPRRVMMSTFIITTSTVAAS